MTVSNSTYRVSYNGNGSTTSFSIPFYFLANSDILVSKLDTNVTPNVETTLSLGTDYNLSGAGDLSGGELTTIGTLVTGEEITIERNAAYTQSTDYEPFGRFPADTIENNFDRLTMLIQQVKSLTDRVPLLDKTTSNLNKIIEEPSSGSVLSWDANGNIVNLTGSINTSNYTYPDANAEERTVVSRLADIISVKDFGAVGDGVTDDTTAIKNASDASAGKILYFPAGTYIVSENDNLGSDTDGVLIENQVHWFGAGAVIKSTTSHSQANNPWSIKIELSNTGVADVIETVIEGIVFDNCQISVASSDNVTFKGCTFRDYRQALQASTCERFKFIENILYNAQANSGGSQVIGITCLFSIFSNNIFDNLDSALNPTVNRIIGAGIQLFGSGSRGNIISNNVIRQAPWYAGGNYSAACIACDMNGSAADCETIVEGNYLQNGETGVYGLYTRGMTVDNNVCIDQEEGHGIYMNNALYSSITDNYIDQRNTSSSSSVHQGIQIQSSQHITVTGNTIRDCENNGINVTGSQRITCTGNTISQVEVTDFNRGISLNGVEDSVFNDNVIYKTNDHGIYSVGNLVNCSISNNVINGYDSVTNGIMVEMTNANDIVKNVRIDNNVFEFRFEIPIQIKATLGSSNLEEISISGNNFQIETPSDLGDPNDRGIAITGTKPFYRFNIDNNLCRNCCISLESTGGHGYGSISNNLLPIPDSGTVARGIYAINTIEYSRIHSNGIHTRTVGVNLQSSGADNNSIQSNFITSATTGILFNDAGSAGSAAVNNVFKSNTADITDNGSNTTTPNY